MKRLLGLLLCMFTAPMAADELFDAAILGCEGIEVPADEFRIVYGPFWDGAWRVTVTLGEAGAPAEMLVENFEYRPADHILVPAGSWSRPMGPTDVRLLRQTTMTMMTEMSLMEEAPELYSQRRPLTLQVGMTVGGSRCTTGYANWPRLPGTYYFRAVELLHAMTIRGSATGQGMPAVRLMLNQVRPASQRR